MYYIEVGNTTFKLAERRSEGAFHIRRFDSATDLAAALSPDSQLLIAPVAESGSAELSSAITTQPHSFLSRADFATFVGASYDTPETLGLDRILNLYGMTGDGLVLSCGTAITVDAVVGGVPAWGAIMSGFETAVHGLNERIPLLPTVSESDLNGIPARTSSQSVANGTLLGTALAALGLARMLGRAVGLSEAHPIILTGGDAEQMARLWPEDISCEIRPALLFEGMERWNRIG